VAVGISATIPNTVRKVGEIPEEGFSRAMSDSGLAIRQKGPGHLQYAGVVPLPPSQSPVGLCTTSSRIDCVRHLHVPTASLLRIP
jgi:hypothetical protein